MKLVASKHVRMTKAGWVGILVMVEGSGGAHAAHPEYRSEPEIHYSLAYGWCVRNEKIFNGEYVVVNDRILVR